MSAKTAGRILEIVCYIEGYKIPIQQISISTAINMPSVATIEIPPVSKDVEIITTSHVAVFCRTESAYASGVEDTREQWLMLFTGEVSGVRDSRNGVNSRMSISVVSPLTYMNRLPNKMLWAAHNTESRGDLLKFVGDAEFFGVSFEDALDKYIGDQGLMALNKKYSLMQYVKTFFKLITYSGKQPNIYYSNADKRYRMVERFLLEDCGDAFKQLWGAYTKSCVLKSMSQAITRGNKTTLDELLGQLSNFGYQMYSLNTPAVVGNKRIGNIITMDMIGAPVPKWNYIIADKDDNIDIMIAPPSLTALKHKYKTEQNQYPVENVIWPSDAVVKGKYKRVANEEIYGTMRESVDMDYYYNAFFKDAVEGNLLSFKTGPASGHLTSKAAYDFMVRQIDRNGISVSKSGFYPQHIMGMPTIVYDNMTKRAYRGNISKISYLINVERGNAITAIEVINVKEITNIDTYDSTTEQRNPMAAKESYKKIYGEISTEDAIIPPGRIKYMDNNEFIEYVQRPMYNLNLFMRDFEAVDEVNVVPDDLASGQEEYPTFVKNWDTAINVATVKNMFIKERRAGAKQLRDELSRRVLRV